MIKIILNGNTQTCEPGKKVGEILADNNALAARVNGQIVDLAYELKQDSEVNPIYFDSQEGRSIFWHSTSHLMAHAVRLLFPDVKLAIGPAIDEGFYYDFDLTHSLTEKDLEKIEAKMRELVKKNLPIVHKFIAKPELEKSYHQAGEKYKLEILSEVPDEKISTYEQDGFFDLCLGPHLSNTGIIKAFKLLSVAGAYWKGDEHNPMLQRIYGVSFPSQEQLDEYITKLEDAKRRDHRKLGPQLGLFLFSEDLGPGLMLWTPKGALMRRIIEDYWIDTHFKAGYEITYTPHIARGHLWETSGHFSYYKENMFTMTIEKEEYALKPMNCPGHILIYKSAVRSYRELPIRYAELGTVYRNERSGVMHGALRVRGFTQDDAHIFCTPDQIEDEIYSTLQLAIKIMSDFGFKDFHIDLSLRDPNHKEQYVGTDEQWDMGEQALIKALDRSGLKYTRREGEATFYAPKIDIKLLDSLGREWQCPTIQFDFNLPSRFNLYYMGADGRHHTPFMIHRAILGALERFLGILIEHYAGAFPVWLNPVQATVLTITEAETDYAEQVIAQLKTQNIRVNKDFRNEKISYKIGEAERDKIPYILIIGKREKEQNKVALRKRRQGDLGAANLETVIEQIKQDIFERR
ncbi:MAG: threonine--tRNA ligase [Candidatus Latescibacteria bacterium]|nr:threonine--tRNA ligase [Candidatus Latescibacterota bacterium]